ncbi:MAG: SMP-30/gluconolactonase/LRE family protein [Acidobacteria bacterium]|nr:SMP-30/gluconolactonase/LRE family protein [Acidobacteriota bacterium]
MNISARAFLVALLVPPVAGATAQEQRAVVRLDPALDEVVSPGARVEKVAGDFGFTEGPVWVRQGGYLIFSDIPANVINKWNPADRKVSVFLNKTGFTGTDPAGVGGEQTNARGQAIYLIGSNGVTLDPQGRVTFNAMGDRQVVRVEADGKRTVLARAYEGKWLNSTNDLVYKRNGSLYFTDPPSGLRRRNDDPKKELPFNGVFLFKGGTLQLLSRDLANPNGIALSPDEKILYVNSSADRKIYRFEVRADDTVADGRLLVDMSAEKEPGVPDGMKVDEKGNLYSTGAGGIWVITPQGKHLGTLVFPEQPANLAFGDADGKTLYVTARSGLYRIRLNVPGVRP